MRASSNDSSRAGVAMSVRNRHRLLVLAACLCAACAAPAAHAEWYGRVEDGIMGTRISMELWVADPATADRAIEAVLAEMRRVDELMSTYKPTSQLSQVNAAAAQHPVP